MYRKLETEKNRYIENTSLEIKGSVDKVENSFAKSCRRARIIWCFNARAFLLTMELELTVLKSHRFVLLHSIL